MDVDALEDTVMADVNLDDAAMANAMDDLFGETNETLELATGVHLPSIAAPTPPALLLRLQDMQTSGCCTKLAWSNSGSIAQIAADGLKVAFRIYAVDATSGKWTLSSPSVSPILAPNGCRFVHLEFNLLGHELVVFDDVGTLYLYSLLGGIGKMQSVAQTIAEEGGSLRTELDAVVGLHWLPIYPLDGRSLYIGPASRSVNGWTSESRTREPNAIKVHHPADNAKALLSVTRKGNLTLRYQQDGWRFLTQNLDELNDLLSHADLCEHNGHILLATYDLGRCLTLFQIALTWNATYAPGPNQTQQVTAIDPRMQITRLTFTLDTSPRHLLAIPLTSLRLLPTTAEVVDSNLATTTTVLGTYVQSAASSDGLGQFGESATVVARWQVETDTQSLHESFKKLKPVTTPANITINKTVLRRQPDLISPKIIFSVQSKYFDTLLTCVASDGTIEVRDRATFDVLEPYMDTEHVSSLVQSGFGYSPTANNSQAVVSSDGSAMVALAPDGKLQATNMNFRYGWQSADGDPANQLAEAAIVCIARQYMIMSCSYIAPDEILSVLPATLPDDLRHLLLKEAFRLARHGPDISSFDERMRQSLAIREPVMPKAYGLQLAVGTTLASSDRTLTAQLAWAVLNLRHICVSVSQSMSRLDPTQPFPPELIHSLRGQCNWGVDLIITLIGALLSAVEKSHQNSSQSASKIFTDYMKDTSSPIFLLVLCSVPRTLLKLLAQFIPRLIKFSQISSGRARTVLERQQLTEVGMMEKTVPFTFDSFKTFLDEVETTLRTQVPENVSLDGSTPQSADTMMSITGSLPEELEPALKTIIASTIPKLLNAADMARIYFADTSWLGLGGPGSVKAANKYDALRKLPLREDAVVRKCRRCGSMMEELNREKPREIMPWLLAAQRNCVCTNNWYVP